MEKQTSGALDWLAAMRVRIDEMTASLRRRFPELRIQSFGGRVGSLTEFQAQQIGLEATLLSGECIALTIAVAYLTTAPRVFADVCWDRGATEASTCDDWQSSTEWPVASADNLARVEQDLPRLIEALRAAIARGGRRPL